MSLLDTPPSYETSGKRTRSKSNRAPRKPKAKKYVADTIDQLDTTSVGGPYHHGGPFDATLRSFNVNKHYSPVAAVKEGNKAAWEATPREAQLDALLMGRPLDGIASVAPGERALNGQVMDYEDGTDMLRDPTAGGGAYKQWPGINYHPDDLKGKGEPGYSIDKARKEREAAAGVGRSKSARERRGEYEMVPQRPRGDSDGRRRRVRSPPGASYHQSFGATGTTTSRPKEVVEGLKRRIGSLGRK